MKATALLRLTLASLAAGSVCVSVLAQDAPAPPAAPPASTAAVPPVDIPAFLKLAPGESPQLVGPFRWPETRRAVQIPTGGGPILHGTYGRTPVRRKAPAVVLLHDDGLDRGMFEGLSRQLLDAGYHVLALDLRGHGESTKFPDGKEIHVEQFRLQHGTPEYRNMVDDMGHVLLWLKEKGGTNGDVYVVGSRMGASIAGAMLARHGKQVKRAVLVSPLMTFQGICLRDELATIQGRPYMVMLAESDTAGVQALEAFRKTTGDVIPAPVPHEGVGQQLLVHQDVRDRIVQFFHAGEKDWPPPSGVPWRGLPRRVHM